MRRYTVHRVDYATRKKEAIGCIVDRRRTGRETRRNFLALLVETRELFGQGKVDAISIDLESPISKRSTIEQGNARGFPMMA